MRYIMTKVMSCSALVMSLAAAAHAQPAFQDAKGESSVFIKDGGGFARINATDKSIELGYLRDTGAEKPFFGLDLKGKASGDFASLFNGGTPSTDAEVGFTLGKRFVFMKSDADIVNKCIAATTAELVGSGLPRRVEEAEKVFIADFKQARIPVLQKELAVRIKESLIKEAREKGHSELLAELIAEELAPKRVEAQATSIAETAEAEAKEAAKAEAEQIRADTIKSAEGEAPGRCLLEEPGLERRSVDWLSFRVAYKRSRYKLLNEGSSFADQVRRQNFDGYSATLAYNRLITLDDLMGQKARRVVRRAERLGADTDKRTKATAEGKEPEPKGSMIVGVSIGVRRSNNADDLDSVEIEDQSFTSSSGTTQRRGMSKQTVLSGEYKEFIAVPLNTDVVWYPGMFRSRLAIDFFTRSDLGKTGREFVPGVGLFITKAGQPTKVVGGISFALDDGKGRIGLVGGFHF